MRIVMPKLGLTMTRGTINEWLVEPGTAVKAEEPLCTYETEKVTLELVAPEDGVLEEILAPAGTTVPAGEAVCEFRPAGRVSAPALPSGPPESLRTHEDAQARSPGRGRVPDNERVAVEATPKARRLAALWGVPLDQLTGRGPRGRVQAADVEAARAVSQEVGPRATPLARRRAAAAGIELAGLRGSGPNGAVTREDVEAAIIKQKTTSPSASAAASTLSGATAGQGETIVPLSTLRRTIGERMVLSASTAPQVTLFAEADASNLVAIRAQLNQELDARGGPTRDLKISYNALLAALVARALHEHPRLNSRLDADGIREQHDINIALAVDTERGLMTPVLHGVDRLSIAGVERGFRELAARALAGKSRPEDLEGGTFTITNLGSMEVDGFTPLINPPQAAILGVGRIVEKPAVHQGAVVIRPMMTLSLSFDHRIIDGAPAARFLQRVKQLVERPASLLL